jgi:hypothetical protein
MYFLFYSPLSARLNIKLVLTECFYPANSYEKIWWKSVNKKPFTKTEHNIINMSNSLRGYFSSVMIPTFLVMPQCTAIEGVGFYLHGTCANFLNVAQFNSFDGVNVVKHTS